MRSGIIIFGDSCELGEQKRVEEWRVELWRVELWSFSNTVLFSLVQSCSVFFSLPQSSSVFWSLAIVTREACSETKMSIYVDKDWQT